MPNPSLIPHTIRSRSTQEIKDEIGRISASTDAAGPVFGAGYTNYRCALRDLRAELATRPAPAPPAPAPALPDSERAGYARDMFALGKSKEHIAKTFGVDHATVDCWLSE